MCPAVHSSTRNFCVEIKSLKHRVCKEDPGVAVLMLPLSCQEGHAVGEEQGVGGPVA